jgi:GNAT superfamily N-acetyltransferase
MLTILSLTGSHDRSGFDCGKAALNEWLARTARQHQEKDISQTFVAVDPATPGKVLGFYALSACEVATEELPPALSARLPRRAGGIRLGRLAVDVSVQRQGLGQLLLMDAIRRACAVRQHIGVLALFVDAKDDDAAKFYIRYGFVALPEATATLVLPLRRACPDSERRQTRRAGRDESRDSRVRRLRAELSEIQRFWSAKAKALGIETEADLERYLKR